MSTLVFSAYFFSHIIFFLTQKLKYTSFYLIYTQLVSNTLPVTMFNQGIQRQQNTQQGFNRAFNTFQTSDAMQTSDNNRARSNTDFQQRLDGDASNRRGGRGTARRGRGTNRGMNRGANRGANRGTGRGRGMVSQSPSRESNALDRALDEAISGSRPPRRKPRPNQPSTSNVGTSLDQALSEFESQKGGYKKQPYIKQQTRLNPNAKPFISQQSSGPAFGGSFHNQGPKNNQFVNNSPFANASPERSTNAFGQQQGATPFKPLQASPFGTPQKSASPFLSQHSSKAPAFVSTPSAPAFNPTQQQLPFGGNVSQPSSAFGGAQQSAFGGNMAQSSSAFGGAQQQQQTPFGGAQKQQQAPFGGNAFGMTQPQQQQRSPFGGNASQSSSAFGRPQQKPMMERKHTTKRDFIEDMPIDEFETAPTRKKQHTGAFSKQAGHFAQKQVKQGSPFEQPKEGSNMGAFSKKDLNPQVASFKPPKQSPLASVGNKEKNQKPPSSMTSRPKNNQTMMVALQSKTTTAADRAIRFGSTEKTNLYDAVSEKKGGEKR
jgi:hypothetical protein